MNQLNSRNVNLPRRNNTSRPQTRRHYASSHQSVNMTKPASAYNVLAMVNNIISKNIKVHTDNKNPNTK